MLINLSNHPSEKWPVEQRDMAIRQFGEIHDIPFPNIPPAWSRDEVLRLVEEYVVKIRQLPGSTVHVMGELTFIHLIVNELTAIGIVCIASTTERIVEMQGDIKKIKFQFVQFRSY